MNGEQVRSALRRRLMLDCLRAEDNLLFEEVGLRHGLARVDFLLVKRLCHGYEIKRRLDALTRLIKHSAIYRSALDRFTVVVTDQELVSTTTMAPVWWGIELVIPHGARLTFINVRDSQENPDVDKSAVVKLLRRAEALEALNALNAAAGVRSKPRRAVYAKLAQCATWPFIREQIHLHLQRRKVAQAAAQ